MAVLPDYVSGTITLANGSTTVTGTGTMFQAAAFKAGDTLQIQNLTAVIASVNSNTSLTLTSPWTGSSLTNAPYRARYLPDGARVTAQTTTLIELLGNGVLTNLAELGVEDGKVPVGNASGEYELVDTDEFGVPDPNGSLGKLATLTLAANKVLTTNGSGNAQQIDLGTLGRALLALGSGTSAQYVQGDGTLQAKTGLPISSATQSALDAKANTASPTLTGTTTSYTLRVGQGTQQGRISFSNNNGVYVAEMGPGVGTGEGNRVGFYSTVNAGWWFGGAVQVTGALSKGSGTFLTDHPLDPFNKNLRHGFVESTEYVNIYRGIVDLVDGRMTVDIDAAFGMMDGTFEALNADVMVSSLQNQYGPDRVWVEGPADSGKFTILCEDTESTATIAWMVTGRRNDAFVRSDLDPNTDSEGRFIPEFDKEDA